jgi:hypothetical protein
MNRRKKLFWIVFGVSLIFIGPSIAILAEFSVISNRAFFLIITIYTGIFSLWIWGSNLRRLLDKKTMEHLLDGCCFLALFLMLLVFTVKTWNKL